MSILLALAMLSQAAAVPSGVNDSVLGKPEDFAFQGPGRVCMREAYIDLNHGEAAHLKYSGIHYQAIEITGSGGTVEFKEGEAWAKPKNIGTNLVSTAELKVVEVGTFEDFRYLAYGRNRYSEGKLVPMVWIDGTGLRGDRSDRKLVSRLVINPIPRDTCDIAYSYGWDVILNGEPISVRRKPRQ